MEYLSLNNGQIIPVVGMGTNTFGKENGMYMAEVNGDFAEAKNVIEAGYRLFDTAISYRNERGIGQVLAESGVPREDFYIVTKIPGTDEYAEVRQAVENSLINLRSTYIDLYLIHHPWENKEGMVRMWNALTELMDEGKIRANGTTRSFHTASKAGFSQWHGVRSIM
jgi:diketogulonate reductase-like aldo/keto reductase